MKRIKLDVCWASIWANRLPMLCLWIAAVLIVGGYYTVPAVTAALRPLADFQTRFGVWAAVANQMFFCGLIPCIFRLCVKEANTGRPIVKSLAQALYCGVWGFIFTALYALQTRLFGPGHDAVTLLCKTALDELFWTPFVSLPMNASFYLWVESDFSFGKTASSFRDHWFRKVYLPNLITNWIIWAPAVVCIYAFPVVLQVQMLGLVNAFWSLVGLQLGRRCRDTAAR